MRLNTVREDIVQLLNEKTTLTRVKETPLLAEFSRDLTESAMKNQLDPLVGREHELERVQQVLCRRTKNNAVLIGEPGVGKTAIVEGLASRIERGDDALGRRDVAGHAEPADLGGDRLRAVAVAVEHGDLRAAPRELACGLGAEPGGTAGDHGPGRNLTSVDQRRRGDDRGVRLVGAVGHRSAAQR